MGGLISVRCAMDGSPFPFSNDISASPTCSSRSTCSASKARIAESNSCAPLVGARR
jgi:hypothetical protein